MNLIDYTYSMHIFFLVMVNSKSFKINLCKKVLQHCTRLFQCRRQWLQNVIRLPKDYADHLESHAFIVNLASTNDNESPQQVTGLSKWRLVKRIEWLLMSTKKYQNLKANI